KLFEAAARVSQLALGGAVAGGDKDAVVTSLPGVTVDFASDIFSDLSRGDAMFHGVLVTEIHNADACANRRDAKGLARWRRTHFERAEVGAMARRPFLGGDIHECDDLGVLDSILHIHIHLACNDPWAWSSLERGA